jgi:lipoate synthase
VYPDIIAMYTLAAESLGFANVACAPLLRSSDHAYQQAHGAGVA